MTLTFESLWEWTKLTVRAPATASRMVKVAALPLPVSVMMIVLAGVVSGVVSGALGLLVPAAPVELALDDGSVATFQQGGPLMQGLYSVLSGLALGYAVYLVGARFGGQGSLADMMGVMAVLQMVMMVIMVLQTVAILAFPLFGLMVLLFGLYVFFRGLGHAVNVGHEFNDMGKSVIVIILSILGVAVAAFIVMMTFGLGPSISEMGALNEL